MSAHDIDHTEDGITRRIKRYSWAEFDYVTGALLYMQDGTVWFHPYNGSSPVCEGRWR